MICFKILFLIAKKKNRLIVFIVVKKNNFWIGNMITLVVDVILLLSFHSYSAPFPLPGNVPMVPHLFIWFLLTQLRLWRKTGIRAERAADISRLTAKTKHLALRIARWEQGDLRHRSSWQMSVVMKFQREFIEMWKQELSLCTAHL